MDQQWLEAKLESLSARLAESRSQQPEEPEGQGSWALESVLGEETANLEHEEIQTRLLLLTAQVAESKRQERHAVNRPSLTACTCGAVKRASEAFRMLRGAGELVRALTAKISQQAAQVLRLRTAMSSVSRGVWDASVFLDCPPSVQRDKRIKNCLDDMNTVAGPPVFRRLWQDAMERKKNQKPPPVQTSRFLLHLAAPAASCAGGPATTATLDLSQAFGTGGFDMRQSLGCAAAARQGAEASTGRAASPPHSVATTLSGLPKWRAVGTDLAPKVPGVEPMRTERVRRMSVRPRQLLDPESEAQCLREPRQQVMPPVANTAARLQPRKSIYCRARLHTALVGGDGGCRDQDAVRAEPQVGIADRSLPLLRVVARHPTT